MARANRRDSGASSPGRLTWRGRAALAVFGVHVVLLFFPPLPPDVKGSLWDYLLAHAAVLLGALELARWAPALADRWQRLPGAGRVAGVYGAAGALLAAGWTLPTARPGLFARFSREEGLWEPLSLLIYVGAALVLWGAARAGASRPADDAGRGGDSGRAGVSGGADAGAVRGPELGILVALYVLLALEEVDYFGVFGGLIGRIDGVYVGSPHDLVQLWVEGLLPWEAAVATGGLLLAAGFAAWRAGRLAPLRVAAVLLRPRAARWLAPGVLLLAFALAGESHVLGLGLERPLPEELLELAGAVFLGALALEVAVPEGFRETRGPDPQAPARAPSPPAGRSGPPP